MAKAELDIHSMKAELEIFSLAPLPPGGNALIRFGKVVVGVYN